MTSTRAIVSLAALALTSTAHAEVAKANSKPVPKVASKKPTTKLAAKASAKPVAKPIVVPATGDLQQYDLLAIAQKRLANMKTDTFTGEVTSQYSGRHFIVRQRVTQKLNANWDYSIDSRELSLKTDDLHEISLFYKSTPKGSFIGQTTMGVKFRIEKSDELSMVVAVSNSYEIRNLEYEIVLSPDEARRLAVNAIVVLEGDLEASDGVLTTCGGEELNASLDDPTLVYRYECSIRANLTRLAIEDGNGVVLASWPAK